MSTKRQSDIVVIGGGAAGLMAAGAAAHAGRRVLLLEQNDRVGKKLGITGKGRCNVTNDCGLEDVMKNIPRNGRFLYSALTAFPPAAAMSFFEGLGVPLKTERGNRVFPVSDRAADIVDALARWAEQGSVQIVHRRAEQIRLADGRVAAVEAGGERYPCACALLATGGVSYRATGSDGWGHREAVHLGHTVTELRPSLVPLASPQLLCAQMQGLSLRNTALTLVDGRGKKVYTDFGELMFTHFGVTGPMVLSASAHMKAGEQYHLLLDLKPALDDAKLDARILRDFEQNHNRDAANAVGGLMPRSMIPVALAASGIAPETKVHTITREQRRLLIDFLKRLRIELSGPRPINEAIITSGGVKVGEIDPKTMASKRVSGLYFAGELIDVDAYTGGFNLQIAWATAMAAARGMAAAVEELPEGGQA